MTRYTQPYFTVRMSEHHSAFFYRVLRQELAKLWRTRMALRFAGFVALVVTAIAAFPFRGRNTVQVAAALGPITAVAAAAYA